MMVDPTYVVDSDVFITAKNLYYSFDICPGFWKSVIHHHREGRVFSVDRARNELLAGHPEEDLVRWVKGKVPEGFFVPPDAAHMLSIRASLMSSRFAGDFQHVPISTSYRLPHKPAIHRLGSNPPDW